MHDLMRLLRVIEREGLLRLSRLAALLHGTLELLHAPSIYKGTRERDRGAIDCAVGLNRRRGMRIQREGEVSHERCSSERQHKLCSLRPHR